LALELALQTSLLGLGIAIILALVAALAGPLLIDWGSHRALFEEQASRLIGVDVRVTGAIDARLLPSPRLTLHDIEIGKAGPENIRARALGIELALGPLLRGEWRATELQLAGPQINLGLDASGRIQAPSLAMGFDPDALAIERLSIADGHVSLTDAASGASVTLDRFKFNGEARSLVGPFKGEGAVTIGADVYPFRLSAGRYSEDGGLKLHLNVDQTNRPLGIEADGQLMLAGAAPRFEGTLSVARAAGIASSGAGSITQPWRVGGKIKASAESALLENLEVQYGAEEQGLKLTGVADFKFGKNPRIDGVLSGRQIDLDRALTGADGIRPLPGAAIRALADLASTALWPAVPVRIGVGIDQVTLGGATVTNVRGDISSDARGWNLDGFEFRAPGFTQVRLSGHLTGVEFTGPADIESADPKALAAWLQGRAEGVPGDVRPMRLRGDVTIGAEKFGVERLTTDFDRKTVVGRLAYFFATTEKAAKLDAELKAPELDVDAAIGFGNILIAGSNIERPHDMNISADIGRATIAGLAARNASVRLKVDSGGLQIDRLSVADLGGAAFSASGRITAQPSPQGELRVDLDAPSSAPVMAVLARLAPEIAQGIGPHASMMAPAKLHARLSIGGGAPAFLAKLGIDVSLGDVRLDGRFEDSDGKALANFATKAALAGGIVSLTDIKATIGGSNVSGGLSVSLATPYRVQGEIEADAIDGAALMAAAIGLPAAPSSGNSAWAWSSEPFTAGAFGEFAGAVALKAKRFDILPRFTARDFRATLRLGNRELALDNMNGGVDGGRLAGQISFRSALDGLKAHAKFGVTAIDAAAVLPAAARPPVSGSLGVSAEVDGSGLSPLALVGSLQGTGKLALVDAQFAGLDPRVFDMVTRAVDQGLTINAARISDLAGKTLDGGQLAVKRLDGTLAINAGQVRLRNVTAESKGAALSLAGNLDLTNGAIDARLALSGSGQSVGAKSDNVPDIFMALKGSAAAPARSIDVSALTGWLTMRAVEIQARRLRAIEGASRAPSASVGP
jgi:uncharacterized protein involved in outer membrane biogenesis